MMLRRFFIGYALCISTIFAMGDAGGNSSPFFVLPGEMQVKIIQHAVYQDMPTFNALLRVSKQMHTLLESPHWICSDDISREEKNQYAMQYRLIPIARHMGQSADHLNELLIGYVAKKIIDFDLMRHYIQCVQEFITQHEILWDQSAPWPHFGWRPENGKPCDPKCTNIKVVTCVYKLEESIFKSLLDGLVSIARKDPKKRPYSAYTSFVPRLPINPKDLNQVRYEWEPLLGLLNFLRRKQGKDAINQDDLVDLLIRKVQGQKIE